MRAADGTAVDEDEELLRAATDFGHIVGSRPRGVLTAHSVDALGDLLAFAGPRGLPVSARGGGQALYGQGQADGGYVVDMTALNEVRCLPGERTLVADAGALWRDVVRAALAEGLAPAVSPDDWHAHFGPAWADLVRAKDRYDPHHILTRGCGLWP
jgi:FAD/FMN-containing dehydrogenase